MAEQDRQDRGEEEPAEQRREMARIRVEDKNVN